MLIALQARKTAIADHGLATDEWRVYPVHGGPDCASERANTIAHSVWPKETALGLIEVERAAKLTELPNFDRLQMAKRGQENAQIVSSPELPGRPGQRRNVAGEPNFWSRLDTFPAQGQPKNKVAKGATSRRGWASPGNS